MADWGLFPAGTSLASRLSEALKESALHRAFFLQLTSGLCPTAVKQWEDVVTAWENDQTKPCPFVEVKNSPYIPYLVRSTSH
jgi:hypothetical protein